MSSSVLKNRKLSLVVDTISIDGVTSPGLRVTAKVTRSLKVTANSAVVTIYNISDEHKHALTKVETPNVALTAGYENQLTRIFVGQAVHVKHEKIVEDGDVTTTVMTTDSGLNQQLKHVKKTFPKGVKAGDVLVEIVKALGIKTGNLNTAKAKLNAGKGATIYVEGTSLSGNASNELTALCRSCGFEWSIQDGALQILDVGKALDSEAIVLDSSLLIGTPSISNKGIVEFMTFLQKDFTPGRQVQIAHPFVSGVFRLEKCEYDLDSYAEQWTVRGEARRAVK
jgi:hypothetical protein